jgi:hypothetical protein
VVHFVKTQEDFKKEKEERMAQEKKYSGAMPSFWRLCADTFSLITEQWKLFLGLGAIYLLAYSTFSQGVSHTDLNQLKDTLVASHAATVATLTAAAFGLSNTTDATASAGAGVAVTIIFGLCLVWATRHAIADRRVKIRDALYNGPTAVIPVAVVLFILFLQSMPMALGIFIYGAAKANGLLGSWIQELAMLLVMALGVFVTLFWYSVSLLSLVTATLPGMYPLKALRTTKELVGPRRWRVVLYLTILTIVIGVIWIVLVMGAIAAGALAFAQPLVSLLRSVTLVVSVVFLYKLYRSLVDEI